MKILHGQNRKTEEPPLALFALCTPFGPPSLLEVPQKDVMFKSKHKLDLALVSMDQRGKMLLGYSDAELANLGGYDLVHYDDLAYVASAHQERKRFSTKTKKKKPYCNSIRFIPLLSVEDGGLGDDSVQIPKERWRMAMAADQLQASLQELETRLRNQHASSPHVSVSFSYRGNK